LRKGVGKRKWANAMTKGLQRKGEEDGVEQEGNTSHKSNNGR